MELDIYLNYTRTRTRNLFRHKRAPISAGHSDPYLVVEDKFLI